MQNVVILVRHPLVSVEDGAYQVYGDFVFYPNGDVRLGPAWFAYGTVIHRHVFGANLVACRAGDRPHALDIETPAGPLCFWYRPWLRKWYQLVELNDPRTYLHYRRYGLRITVALYYLRRGTRRLITEAALVSLIFVLSFLACLLLLFLSR